MVEQPFQEWDKMAIFLPENKELAKNVYQMPKKLKQHVINNFVANNQYSQSPGFKKALHLCDPTYNDRSLGKSTQGKKGIPYRSLKRLKNAFDYAEPKGLEYELMGGEEMRHWVEDTLNRERNKVKPVMPNKKPNKLKNGINPPTVNKPLQSGDVKVTVHESYDIQESKKSKIIKLTESQFNKLLNNLQINK